MRQINRAVGISRRSILLVGAVLLFLSVVDSETARSQETIQYPVDVAVTSDGTVFVADLRLPGIWKIEDGAASVFFQAEKKIGSVLYSIRCIGIDSDGRLLAGDTATSAVYRFDESGSPTRIHEDRIGMPMSVVGGPDGAVYVTDTELGHVIKLTANDDGTMAKSVVASVAGPRGICLTDDGNLLVVTGQDDQVVKVDSAGEVSAFTSSETLAYPSQVAVFNGTVYLCDSYKDTVYQISEGQEPVEWVAGEPFVHPVGLFATADSLFVADSRGAAIFSIDTDGSRTELTLTYLP